MTNNVEEALNYAESSSKLEGIQLSEQEKLVILTKIEQQEDNIEYIEYVKKLVKSKDKMKIKENNNGKIRR